MPLALHPFVIGQPSRHRYLDQALEYAVTHRDVGITTSDEIADHYLNHYPTHNAKGLAR